ncbi:hypothetical protein IP88_02995 [alpha proteobacterium AAP81b]|nr:hypothetical protein IP88_02995 [alpha proteobacterium AAP81b]
MLAIATLGYGASHFVASAAERGFPATGFDRVEATGSEDVTIVTGGAPSVTATGPQARLDRLDIRVEGNTLRIGHKRGMNLSWSSGDDVRIRVTMPALAGIELTGSGNVTADRGSGAAFGAKVTGSGDLSIARLDSSRPTLSITGSGNLTAAGRCDAATLSVAGSGDLILDKLVCNSADVSVMGSGDVRVTARQTASANLMGSGDIVITGGAKCTTRKMGSGDISCG